MAITVNVNGVPIQYPQTGDTNWADDATNFAIQTSAALGKIGLSSGTSVDITGTLGISNGTALAPAITPSGDTNTGLYSISADKIGFSANGARVGEFGVGYGGFTGNIIQVVQSTNTYKHTIATTSYSDLLSAVGTVWEVPFTPKYSNSKILIIYSIQGELTITGSNTQYMGIGISKKIGAGSYSQIYNPGERQFGMAGSGLGSVFTTNQFSYNHLDDSNTTNQINYKFQCKILNSASGAFYVNMNYAGNYVSSATIMEIQQ